MNRNLALAARRSAPWVLTVAATAGSAFALDGLVTAAGLALAASGLLSDLDGPLPLVFLVCTYLVWGGGLRANLAANWALLARTATSTNVLSKAAHDLVFRQGIGSRIAQPPRRESRPELSSHFALAVLVPRCSDRCSARRRRRHRLRGFGAHGARNHANLRSQRAREPLLASRGGKLGVSPG